MNLEVRSADREDVYRDIARIPESHRVDTRGRTIPEGSVCVLRVGSHRAYALVRGLGDSAKSEIRMDERLRNLLEVNVGNEIEVEVKTVGICGQIRWAWTASDPGYRVAARLSVLSVVLGLLGAVLGVIALRGIL